MAPRRRNLAEIVIGQQLLPTGDGFRLSFQAEATKAGVPLEVPVPASLLPCLRAYLDRHRPVLLGSTTDHRRLWVNIDGSPLAYEALWGLFERKGRALLGRRINPHLTRHTMATTLLSMDPTAIRTASAALTHRGTRSVSEVYDRSGMAGAEATWRKLLRERRQRRMSDQ